MCDLSYRMHALCEASPAIYTFVGFYSCKNVSTTPVEKQANKPKYSTCLSIRTEFLAPVEICGSSEGVNQTRKGLSKVIASQQ